MGDNGVVCLFVSPRDVYLVQQKPTKPLIQKQYVIERLQYISCRTIARIHSDRHRFQAIVFQRYQFSQYPHVHTDVQYLFITIGPDVP